MADYQQTRVNQVFVQTSIVLWSHVVTTEAGFDATLIYVRPEYATQEVGVETTVVVSRTYVLAESIGMEASLVVTLPTDGRTTWLSVVDDAPDHVHEVTPFVRGKTFQQNEYGTLTLYTRQFVIPRGNHGHAALETVLAPGAHMKTLWADEWFSLGIDGPKVIPGSTVQQHVQDGKATGTDVVQVTFAAIKTLAPFVAGAYNVTARRLLSKDTFSVTWGEWGIAASVGAANVPYQGQVLAGYSTVFALVSPKCMNVTFDDTTLPGRVLVKSMWRAKRLGTSVYWYEDDPND